MTTTAHRPRPALGCIVALLAAAATPALAATPDPALEPLTISGLSLNLDEAVAREARGPEPSKSDDGRARGYGLAGSRWWTVGGAYANDFKDANDFNVHGAFSQFLADELEFAVEAAAWYFDQPGQDTGGLSGSMVFRWHFAHADDWDWSVFADAGIGLLGAFDEVPDGGTGFDFLPRLGAGFTKALGPSVDGESRGPRLMVGVRWHHISNGRISGDARNPSRDGLMGYAAVVFAF